MADLPSNRGRKRKREWGVGNGEWDGKAISLLPLPIPHSPIPSASLPFLLLFFALFKKSERAAPLSHASPFSLHRRSDPLPPDAGAFVKKAIGARVEGEMHVEGAGEDVLARDETPIAAVFAVIAAVAHHEVLVRGDLDRFGHPIDRPGSDLEIISVGIPVDVVVDSVPRALWLRFDFDDWQFRFLRQTHQGALFRQFLAVNVDAVAFDLDR